jgi:spore maturation protein CgeB
MIKLKILITDSHDKSLLAPQYVNYFLSLGYEIVSFYQSEYWKPRNLLDKVRFRINPNPFYKRANKVLIDLVNDEKPDVVLLFKAMEIFPETLIRIKKSVKLLINYNPDHPFRFISRASGNINVLKSIPLYDVHITYSYKIRKELMDSFKKIKTEVLPFGFDSSYGTSVSFDTIEEIKKVCFIGYCDKHRADVISLILSNNIDVDVYGEKWDKYFKHKPANLNVYNSISGVKYYEILRTYRVQLNLLRKHNEDSHNMRSFEIPGCGGIMLAPLTTEHENYFVNGKEAFLYKDFNELIILINKLLDITKDEANVIRDDARTRSLQSGYTYKDRTNQLIQIIHKYNETRRDVYTDF